MNYSFCSRYHIFFIKDFLVADISFPKAVLNSVITNNIFYFNGPLNPIYNQG